MNLFVLFGRPPLMMDAVSATIFGEERRVLGEDMIAKRLMAGIANGQT